MTGSETDAQQEQAPVIRDKRRLDPETGELRRPAASPASAAAAAEGSQPTEPGESGQPTGLTGPGESAEPAEPAVEDETARQLAERTADLQRLQAEYANYRRRVERDREVVRETAIAQVLTNLLPILDDIGRAREHGELEGGFKSVGEALEQMVERLGLAGFGAAGDAFDPTVHEALTHTHSADVTEPTCIEVFQPGYRIGERVVRPARVAVADPE